MIIDSSKKFIFIKTKKTASTSIEIALSSLCSEDAVVTAIKPEDEAIRTRFNISSARNYRCGESQFLPSKEVAQKFARRGFYNHMSAWDVKRILKAQFEEYLKISIVRNPWDRVVSHYYWGIKDKGVNAPSFKDYLRGTPENINCNERLLFHPSKDKLLVDYVIKFENIEQDVKKIQKKLNVDEDLFSIIQNSSSKTNVRPKRTNPYELYCDYTSSLVEMLCEKEIEYFDYKRPY